MYQNISINLSYLLLSLSDALDLASSELSQHQLRTAFIAWEVGNVANLSSDEMEQLFIAALLHDIGALSPEDKINIHQAEVINPEAHCILGERILKRIPMFEPSSKIVRFHHTRWQTWGGKFEEALTFLSQILLLADTLERSLDRNQYILYQDQEIVSKIGSMAGTSIDPKAVAMFRSIAFREDFWLDLVSPRLYSLLLHKGPCRGTEIDLSFLIAISELFRNIIDFRSHFTATHSSGVAASASAISRLLGLTEVETELMEVTGNLHDLGKMAIPTSILSKPDKLTKDEIAIMRQHTYFTYSVLNTIGGIQQVAEWAAFHHERLNGSGYPFHLEGKKLSIGTRIMAVADIFTALAEERPYRKGMKQHELLSILKDLCVKGFIDKTIVRVLEENYDEIVAFTKERQIEALDCYEQEFAHL